MNDSASLPWSASRFISSEMWHKSLYNPEQAWVCAWYTACQSYLNTAPIQLILPSSEHQTLFRLFRWGQCLYGRSQNRVVSNKIRFQTRLQAQNSLYTTYRSGPSNSSNVLSQLAHKTSLFLPACVTEMLEARYDLFRLSKRVECISRLGQFCQSLMAFSPQRKNK